jgi:hypothetical protein
MSSLTKDLDAEWYDSTKLNTYRLCPQKYKYRVGEHLTGTEPEWALMFGIAMHKALETVYDGTYASKVDFEGQEMYRYQAEFIKHYPIDPEKGPRTKAVGMELQAVGMELLTNYIYKWREEPFDVLGVEVPFAIPIRDADGKLDFYIVGRMDLVINWDDETLPADHKTTSYFGDHFEKGFKVDLQPTIYSMALNNDVKKSTKILINALRVTAKINDESFVRKVTTRTPEELQRTLKDIRFTVDCIRRSIDMDIWPRHGSQACFAYNRTCEFYALCASSNQQAETLKETAYKREEWQPV